MAMRESHIMLNIIQQKKKSVKYLSIYSQIFGVHTIKYSNII